MGDRAQSGSGNIVAAAHQPAGAHDGRIHVKNGTAA